MGPWAVVVSTLAWFLLATLVGNAAAFLLTGRSIHAARAGARWRVEDTFSLLALLGLWPGALLAMGRHRHPVRRTSMRRQLLLVGLVGTALWTLAGLYAWWADAGA